ncbi:MAG TPA: ribonuclease E activity regulator RraA [Gammaproteobacteria bacterium]|nr:ribonuclease E activity regulator RraA [Gammaproteobacteria bacterium]
MRNKTTDICDQYSERLRIATPIFSDYGGRKLFEGRVVTVKVFEDNSLVRAALAEAGQGRVLVVDGGGSMRCALLGDQLAELGHGNGWAGVIVYGCIRDSADIAKIDLGVKALQTHPLRSVKKGVGERDVPVTFAGITIRPGDYLYADEDGVVVADEALS